MVLKKKRQNFEKSAEICPKSGKKSENRENINLMLFWNTIPLVLDAYSQYCDMLNTIYSTNHNFIKCDNNGRKTKEIGK